MKYLSIAMALCLCAFLVGCGGESVELGDWSNTVCPVSKEKIEGEGVVGVYKNSKVHFCCQDCFDEFFKDTRKYDEFLHKVFHDNQQKEQEKNN